jgi:TolB protein
VPFAALALVLLAALLGCAGKPAPPAPSGEGAHPEAPSDGPAVRVLFLGNSLTAGNDLPELVRAMAAAGGVRLVYQARTLGGTALEDHWNDTQARPLLAGARWDYLVLQQGPSSLPASQAHLRDWAVRWADEARRRGAKPALYMVWPFQGQAKGFELVSQSYRRAAEASGSRLLPAGDAWAEALRDDPTVPLYQSDRLHPTEAGSYLAALVIAAGLTGIQPEAVPARLTLGEGRILTLPEGQARALRRAASKVLARESRRDAAVPPSGGKIAFTRGDVWFVGADGGNARRLTKGLEHDRPLAWSPDGSRLLFWKHSKVGWDVWVTDADGKNQKNLTATRSGGCRSPRWSPDGRTIAFLRDDPEGLYLMDTDGKNQRRISRRGHRDEAPAWSPDGRRIAYVHFTPTSPRTGRADIYVIDRDGKNDACITKSKGSSTSPAWSPDGKKIAFQGRRGGSFEICTINPDGRNEKVLTKGTRDNADPVWSPDGSHIAYVAYKDGNCGLYIMGSDGRGPRRLAAIEGRPERQSWSPDGKRLAFGSAVGGRGEVYVVGADGKGLTRLTRGGGSWPAWQPVRKR